MNEQSLSPPPRQRLIERIDGALARGDLPEALHALGLLEADGVDATSRFARWTLLSQREDISSALAFARQELKAHPEEPELWYALGVSLLHTDVEEASVALEESCYLDPSFDDAWHALAQTREDLGDPSGARAAFTRVWELDTAEPLPPLLHAPELLLHWTEQVARSLPEELREATDQVPIFIEGYPARWIVEQEPWDPRILGLFEGPTHAERQSLSAPELPHISLFQRNLERQFPDPHVLAEEVRVTLIHELGHYLGLDESDLAARGLT